MLNVLVPKDRDGGVPRDDGSAVPEWKFGEAQLSDSDDDGHVDETDADDGASSVSVAPFSAVTGAPARAGEDAVAARSTDWVDVKLLPGNPTARTAASRQSKVFGFTSSTKASKSASRKGSGSRRTAEAAEDAAELSAAAPSVETGAEPAPPAESTPPADVNSPPEAPVPPPAPEVNSPSNGADGTTTTQPQPQSSSSPERL